MDFCFKALKTFYGNDKEIITFFIIKWEYMKKIFLM